MKLLAAMLAFFLLLGFKQSRAEDDVTIPARRLEEIQKNLEFERQEAQRLRKEAEAQQQEMIRLRGEMVAAARNAQEQEDILTAIEQQLKALKAEDATKIQALERRKHQMSDVLIALERLAWRPMEALIASPAHPADAVRSSMLLRAAIPQIQEDARSLRKELEEIAAVRAQIAKEREKMAKAVGKLDEEHQRLKVLYQKKSDIQYFTQEQQKEHEKKQEQLAMEAEDLKDLLAKLEAERKKRMAEAAARAAKEAAERKAAEEAARKAALIAQRAAEEAARKKAEEEAAQRAALEAAQRADQEAARLAQEKAEEETRAAKEASDKARKEARNAAAAAQAVPPAPKDKPVNLLQRSFDGAKGALVNPARGRITSRFGEANANGHSNKGMNIATRAHAQVVATYDGTVVYAGPFRGYGQLLIIDHGDGYHSLLSGMANIDCSVGQLLLAGEPVGTMGEEEDKPELYVELRRNGQPINPAPWLAAKKEAAKG